MIMTGVAWIFMSAAIIVIVVTTGVAIKKIVGNQ